MPHVTEDQLTESLASALAEPAIRTVFVDFLFAGRVPDCLHRPGTWEVTTQYRFSDSSLAGAGVGSRGRLDLMLLHRAPDGIRAIGVEHKVWDEEKPSRLHNYKLLLNAEGFAENWLFEIVRESDYDLSRETFLAGVYRWRELRKHLERSLGHDATRVRQLLTDLYAALERSGSLKEGVIVRKNQHSPNATPEAADWLDRLLPLLHPAEGRRLTDKGFDVHIRAALPAWRTTHQGRWYERLFIFPKRTEQDGWAFQMQLVFHNANFTQLEYAKRLLPRWAPPFAKEGLVIYAGPPRGWDGDKRVTLKTPYHLHANAKYFYAEEPPELAFQSSSSQLPVNSFLANAAQRAVRYLTLFEQVALETQHARRPTAISCR